MELTINYRQLQLARESRGYTQTKLTSEVENLSQSNLSKMEKGLLPIPKDTLLRIATTLDYPIDFFYKRSQLTPIGTFYYRKRVSLPKSTLMLIEAKRDIVRLAIDELSKSVEVKECTLPLLEVTPDRTASDIARIVRNSLKLPKGPIKDLIRVIEDAGIIVYEMDFETDKLMGFSIYTDSGQPIIFLNRSMPNDRKRFTLGHELGHLAMHISFDLDIEDKIIEQQADEFSSEFSMPLLECYKDLVNLRLNNLGTLKAYWKLSKSAIIRRALTARTITPERYQYFMIELSRMGERKQERGSVELDSPMLLKQMVDIHTNDLRYSTEEMSSMLGLSCKDYLQLFRAPAKIDLRLCRR